MHQPATVMAVGAACFGVSVGFVTYRTLVRTTDKAAITDIAAVIAAVGGAAVTGLFNPKNTDLFGWYSIGLLAGIAVFFILYLIMNGKADTAKVMSGRLITDTRNGGGPQPGPRP